MAAGFKTATVNASSVPSTQTNFPSYVDLSRLGITTLAEAQSVRVYADSSKTTEWAREIVSAAEMHVKVPSLTSTVSIYVDWDGTSSDYAATDTYGRNAVWSDYTVVYHLEGASTDSTASGFNGTDTAITYGTSYGKLGGQGASFNGSTSIINCSNNSALNYATTNYTIQAWAQPRANSGAIGILNRRASSGSNSGYALGYDWTANDKFAFVQRSTTSVNYEANFSSTSSINNWYAIHGVYDSGAGTSIIYVDATAASLSTPSRASISATTNFYIGAIQATALKWNGYIDEVRARSSALSANWITTEYNNQSAESTFWGTWSDVVGGSANTTNFFIMS